MYFNTDAEGEHVQNRGTLMMEPARAPKHALYRTTYDHPLPSTLRHAIDAPGRPAAHAEFDRTWGHILGRIPMEDVRWQRLQDFYFNSLTAVDSHVMTILDELEALSLTDRSALVYTSDHGEMAGAHGLRGKGPFCYEENLHLPMYVVHPDVAGGQQCAALSSHIDIVPTLLALGGAPELGAELPGKDLSPAITDPSKAKVDTVRDSVLFTYSGLVANDANIFDLLARRKAGEAGVVELNPGLFTGPGQARQRSWPCSTGGTSSPATTPPRKRNRPESPRRATLQQRRRAVRPPGGRQARSTTSAMSTEHDAQLLAMNDKLNAIMDREYGVDDGRELPATLIGAGLAAELSRPSERNSNYVPKVAFSGRGSRCARCRSATSSMYTTKLGSAAW